MSSSLSSFGSSCNSDTQKKVIKEFLQRKQKGLTFFSSAAGAAAAGAVPPAAGAAETATGAPPLPPARTYK